MYPNATLRKLPISTINTRGETSRGLKKGDDTLLIQKGSIDGNFYKEAFKKVESRLQKRRRLWETLPIQKGSIDENVYKEAFKKVFTVPERYPPPKQGNVRLRLNLQIRRLQKRLRRRRGNRSLSNPRNWPFPTHQEGVSKATKYTSHAVAEKRMLSTEEQQPKAKKMATTQTVQQIISYASVATREISGKRTNRKAKAGPVANASHKPRYPKPKQEHQSTDGNE